MCCVNSLQVVLSGRGGRGGIDFSRSWNSVSRSLKCVGKSPDGSLRFAKFQVSEITFHYNKHTKIKFLGIKAMCTMTLFNQRINTKLIFDVTR